MNDNGKNPAFPVDPSVSTGSDSGLTKREYFAAMALQGIVSNCGYGLDGFAAARKSVECADAILLELEKPQQ